MAHEFGMIQTDDISNDMTDELTDELTDEMTDGVGAALLLDAASPPPRRGSTLFTPVVDVIEDPFSSYG